MNYDEVNDILDKTSFESIDFMYRFVLTQLNPKTIRMMKKPNDFDYKKALYFIRVHSIASSITFFYDNIDVDNAALDMIFEKMKSFNAIATVEDISTYEKIKQIRNCFAHGHYKIRENLDGIYIDNGKVKGIINDRDLEELNLSFGKTASFDGISKRREFYTFEVDDANFLKNRILLNKELNKFKYYKISASEGENNVSDILSELMKIFNVNKSSFFNNISKKIINAVLKGFEHFDFKTLMLNEDEKKLINSLINNITFNKIDLFFKTFPEAVRNGYGDILIEVVNQEGPFIYDTDIYTVFILVGMGDYVQQNKMTDELVKNSIRYIMSLPFVFAKMLLQYSFFTFDYLREMNERHNNELFEYKNFDMTGIYYDSLIGEELVREVDPIKRLRDSIMVCNNKIKKLDDAKSIKVNKKSGLERNFEKIPNAESMIEKIKSEIIEIDAELNPLKEELLELSVQMENHIDGEYVDCRNLFRHLRNSISHKRCKVDYKQAINRNDFSLIQFRFEDYDNVYDSEGKVVGEKLVFTMECDAKTLFRFLKDINFRVNKVLKHKEDLNDSMKKTV